MLYKLYMLWFALRVSLCNCSPEVRKSHFLSQKKDYILTKTGKMPKCINENSGLAKAWQEDYFWIHNDSGGKPELYMINEKGRVFDTLQVDNAQNIDWEDLTKDNKGNIYIGDFGNNSQNRKDLCIYKYRNHKTEKITFHYSEQSSFPSSKRIFDCEAFFWYRNRLYLFSKSIEKEHQVLLYSLSDQAGDNMLMPQDSIFIKSQVTAADISPNGKEFALLTYGKILFFEINNEKIDFSKPKNCIKIGKNQTEALAYLNDSDLILTNEQRKIYVLRR
jgi:hypothetical protein